MFTMGMIVNHLENFYFLMWVTPFIVGVTFIVYVKYTLTKGNGIENDTYSSDTVQLKRKITRWRITLSLLGILTIYLVETHLYNINNVYFFFGTIIYLVAINVLLTYYSKQKMQ